MKSTGVLLMSAVFVIVLAVSASAITGILGNSRAVLYPKVGFWGTTIDRTLEIRNENNVSINVKLEADNNSAKFIDIVDKSFTLDSGQTKNAAFKINIKSAGDYDLKVNVFYSPADGKGAGVVLTAEMIVHASKDGGSSGSDSSSSDVSGSDNQSSHLPAAINLGFLKDKSNTGIIFASVSTIILAVLLVLLISLNRRKKISKRSDRSG